jgi:(S)-2-hydroxyglutarate dehydrogenase
MGSLNDREADVVVVGGGIVGLATAWTLVQRDPSRRVCVLEKERRLAQHQSGRNSGVIHSGIYYKPGSLKAQTCRQGKEMLESFCRDRGIAMETCGKVIVAIEESEEPQLEEILRRGVANGVQCERIDAVQLRALEPQAAGIAAIHVRESGIVDYVGMCERMAAEVVQAGSAVVCTAAVQSIQERAGLIEVKHQEGTVRAGQLINCAGLYSDRIARLAGLVPEVQIVPFRGEYYELEDGHRGLCRNLIYPVPDPAFPFLGVHLTRMFDGRVECGPNAVLALAREGYGWGTIAPGELAQTLTFGGFLRLAVKYWQTGAGEIWRSISKRAFVRALQRLVPALEGKHLRPGRAGVRAQAVRRDGTLVDDFLFQRLGQQLHVLNAPSPAATASLAIGRSIVEQLEKPVGS